jgi:hypothetical protein
MMPSPHAMSATALPVSVWNSDPKNSMIWSAAPK